MDLRWKHPFTCLCSGPSGCGKTVFVKRFLYNLEGVCDVIFDKILFYYAEYQDSYRTEFLTTTSTFRTRTSDAIHFIEGLPNVEDYSQDDKEKKLIIIDDFMRESSNNTILDLFTKHSHHKDLSVIFITQNIFHQGKGQRDMSLNTSYIIMFKNPRDRAQILFLARQVYPENPKFLQEAYIDATKIPHGYLLLDLKQATPEELRFRACIFPDDEYHYVYVPKLRK